LFLDDNGVWPFASRARLLSEHLMLSVDNRQWLISRENVHSSRRQAAALAFADFRCRRLTLILQFSFAIFLARARSGGLGAASRQSFPPGSRLGALGRQANS
jgi:hypothetical protein